MKCAARLRDLVLVMWEDEIDAATVDVELFAEVPPGHRRALDVPAGPSLHLDAAWRWPSGLAWLGRLPQDEVHGIALVRRNVHAGACKEFIERAPRKTAVAFHRCDGEQDVILLHIG